MTTTLYRRGRVRSATDPFATALLVEGDTVVWVGSEDGADAMTAQVTVELDDAWLAPAFVDAHVHATSTGLALTGLDLTGSPSLAAALQAVERASRAARGAVLLGTGWDDSAWPERRPPTAAELDRASYGGVVYLARTDVHSAVASSALLAACPAARALPGYLPDGLVRTAAHHAVREAAYAALTPAQRRAAQRAMLDRAASLGIACVHECAGPSISSEQDLLDLLAMEHGVERVGYWGELDAVERARGLGAAGAAGDLFADGALGSHTACLSAPYVDEPTSGHPYLDADQIGRHVAACTRAGLQAGFHAIGDAALQAVVDGFGRAALEVGDLRAARHRVEHAELITAGQIGALASYGVVASVQPAFDAHWGGPDGMYAARLGRERAGGMNLFASMIDAGLPLALGTDSPVTPFAPWAAISACVNHHDPAQRISAQAAFLAHTREGWRAAGIDDHGYLDLGRPASFAIWSAGNKPGLPDLSPGATLPTCLRTVIRGRTVFDRLGAS